MDFIKTYYKIHGLIVSIRTLLSWPRPPIKALNWSEVNLLLRRNRSHSYYFCTFTCSDPNIDGT